MTDQDAKRAFRRVALAGLAAVVAFVAVSLGFARRSFHHRMQRCDEQMGPLVAQVASAEAVGQRIGTSGEEFVRGRQADLVQRAAAWRPGANALASIREKAAQSASSRLYMDVEEGVIYVAFFDETQHVKGYVCFEDHGD
jgi:hypothetical protein